MATANRSEWVKTPEMLSLCKAPSFDPLLEIAQLQRQGCRQNLLVLFDDIPQTKAEKEGCLLKGGNKK